MTLKGEWCVHPEGILASWGDVNWGWYTAEGRYRTASLLKIENLYLSGIGRAHEGHPCPTRWDSSACSGS
jgi:hypothetical protein